MPALNLEDAKMYFQDCVDEYRKNNAGYQPAPPCKRSDIPEWYPECLKLYLSEISMDIIRYSYMNTHEFIVNKPVHDTDKLDKKIRAIGLEEFYKNKIKAIKTKCLERIHGYYLEYCKNMKESVELISLGCSNVDLWYVNKDRVVSKNYDIDAEYGCAYQECDINNEGESLESYLGL